MIIAILILIVNIAIGAGCVIAIKKIENEDLELGKFIVLSLLGFGNILMLLIIISLNWKPFKKIIFKK